MGSSIIRNIVGALVLIVLSFIIGIMAADSAKQAALIIIAAAAIIGIIAMGKHVWITLFLLPPVFSLLPKIGGMSLSFILFPTVLCYWLLLRLLGYVKFTWRKLIGADLFVFCFTILIGLAFYRKPASIDLINNLFNIETEFTTARAYPEFIASLILYICLSCIPFQKQVLLKLFKYYLILTLVISFTMGIFSMFGTLSGDDAETSRYSMFRTFAEALFIVVYSGAPFAKLIVSPKAIFAIFISTAATVFSGFRSMLGQLGLIFIIISVIKRECYVIGISLAVGIVALGILNASDLVKTLPFAAQRALCAIPGLEVKSSIRRATDSSTNWRVEMWKWALDPRTGHIKDYVLGDSFGIEKSYQMRSKRAIMRGELRFGDAEDFAKRRATHSLFIDTLQSVGYLGFFVVYGCTLYATFAMFKINTALRDTQFFIYSMFFTCRIAIYSVYFLLSTSGLHSYISTLMFTLAYLKIFHNIAVDEGKIFKGKKAKYVPMLIKQQQEV